MRMSLLSSISTMRNVFFAHVFGILSTSTCLVITNNHLGLSLSQIHPWSLLFLMSLKIFLDAKNYIWKNAAGMRWSNALLLGCVDTCYQGTSLFLRFFFHTYVVCMTYSHKSWRILPISTYLANGLEDLRLEIFLPYISITADTRYRFNSKL